MHWWCPFPYVTICTAIQNKKMFLIFNISFRKLLWDLCEILKLKRSLWMSLKSFLIAPKINGKKTRAPATRDIYQAIYIMTCISFRNTLQYSDTVRQSSLHWLHAYITVQYYCINTENERHVESKCQDGLSCNVNDGWILIDQLVSVKAFLCIQKRSMFVP